MRMIDEEELSPIYKEEFLDALITLQEFGPFCPDVGICGNLNWNNDGQFDAYTLVPYYSIRWTKFSGNEDFPIPSNSERKWSGKALKLRNELIDFMIEEVTRELRTLTI